MYGRNYEAAAMAVETRIAESTSPRVGSRTYKAAAMAVETASF